MSFRAVRQHIIRFLMQIYRFIFNHHDKFICLLSPNKLSEKSSLFLGLLFVFLERIRPAHKPVVLIYINLTVNFSIDGMQLILHHYLQVAVRNLIHHLVVCKVKVLYERRYLPQQALIAYCCCFGFAISFPTFRAKADSIVKFWVFTRLYALHNA